MSEAAKGVLAMTAACTVWGLSALYYKMIAHVPPLEVLSHRTLWSLVFFGAVLAVQGRLGQIGLILRDWRTMGIVALAALMISSNWFLFIFSIQIGHAVEASLGYYIFPLVSVIMGAMFLRERHSMMKWAAVALAGGAVSALTLGLGVPPWISLAIALSFGFYGLIKKRVSAGPVVSVTTEVLFLAPLALFWLWGVHTQGWTGIAGRTGAAFGSNWHDSLILMFSGPLTALPLILFSYASRRVTMATIGLTQYLNPTLQFLVATLAFREPFGFWHAVAFPLIWLALALYSAETLRQDRASRRALVRAGTSGETVI